MKNATIHFRTLQDTDPAQRLLAFADRAFMGFYAHVRRNARRITRLVIAFLPLMMLLVGSCKTSQTSAIDNIIAGMDDLRAALFPDRVIARDVGEYQPAAGYVARARGYVEGNPDSLTHLTEQEIGYIFGAPAMKRHDADARIWQYRSGACVVDFYFYDQPGVMNESAVAYVDFRLKNDLIPGSVPRTEPVDLKNQSKCLKRIAG
ncbi:MAG: hypothetical protein ACAH83_08795 [Alphaproteobacteria bacterium]